MDLKPWNPWEQFEKIQKEINRTLDDFFRHLWSAEEGRAISFVPAVDLWETETEIVLVVEIPGVLEEDVDVSVTPSCLVLRGARAEVPRGRALIQEWRWGEFEREVSLPSTVDPDSMTATFSEGTLEIRLRKRMGR